MTYVDDAKLVRRCMAGEQDAWGELVSRYEGLIRHTVRRILSGRRGRETDPSLPEEMVSVVFAHLWEENCRRLREFQWESAFSTWLVWVTIRLAQNHLRDERREVRKREAFYADRLGPEAALTEEPLDRQERIEAVRRGLSRLSPEERRLLIEVYRKGRSQKEIARNDGVPETTLFYRLVSAKKKLISFLRDVFPLILL